MRIGEKVVGKSASFFGVNTMGLRGAYGQIYFLRGRDMEGFGLL